MKNVDAKGAKKSKKGRKGKRISVFALRFGGLRVSNRAWIAWISAMNFFIGQALRAQSNPFLSSAGQSRTPT
jgi:hypothetical protein